MADVYTSGSWRVKEGRGDEFVAAWRELAEWSKREIPGAVGATLVRDLDDPGHFVSFGPWESVAAVRSWRGRPGYQERVARMLEVLESFEPRTLEVVVSR